MATDSRLETRLLRAARVYFDAGHGPAAGDLAVLGVRGESVLVVGGKPPARRVAAKQCALGSLQDLNRLKIVERR